MRNVTDFYNDGVRVKFYQSMERFNIVTTTK